MDCPHCGDTHGDELPFCPLTGRSLTELLPIGTSLEGKYRIEASLGAGAFGAVFRARHELLDKDVAVKVLQSADEMMMQRLLREARVASATGHPNIVAVTDAGHCASGAPFVVMELVEGKTLEEVIGERPLAIPRAIELAMQLLSGLASVHQQGVVHRDLKPENLMVVTASNGAEQLKILDFGISKILVDDPRQQVLTATGAILGTPAYMSPEQAMGLRDVGPAADLWAVGAVLYQMLTGRPPHVAETAMGVLAAKLRQAIAPPSQHNPAVPAALDAIVLRALQEKPEARFDDAEQMRAALAALGPTAETETAPPSAPVKAPAARAPAAKAPAAATMDEPATVLAKPRRSRDAALREPEPTPKPKRPRRVTEPELAGPPSESELATSRTEAERTGPRRSPQPAVASGTVYAPPPSRAVPWRLLLTLVVLAALAGGGFWAYQRFFRQPDVVDVWLETVPANAQIFVAGDLRSGSPLRLQRASGAVMIEVRAAGYRSAQMIVRPEPGSRWRVELRPLAGTAAARDHDTKPPHRRRRPKVHKPVKPGPSLKLKDSTPLKNPFK